MDPIQTVITDCKKIVIKAKGIVSFQGDASEASTGWPTRINDYRNTNNVSK